jgi:hypothetical protein
MPGQEQAGPFHLRFRFIEFVAESGLRVFGIRRLRHSLNVCQSQSMSFSAITNSTDSRRFVNQGDEKAGLLRDAIRSQCSTCSRHNKKETGNEKD